MTKLTRFVLASCLLLSPLAVWGQNHEAAKQEAPAQQSSAQGHEIPAQEAGAEGHGTEARGAAMEAEHGGEKGGAHHGPAMKLFGKSYGNLGAFLVQLLNFAIYGAGLFFLLKGALSAMFKARKEELVTLLSQAERDKAEGEAQVVAMAAKMEGLEAELAGILDKAQADAEFEKQRVLEAAKAEASQILAQAQAEIGHQRRLAEQELRALVAELAVEGATQRLQQKLQGAEAAQVLDRAIHQIGGAQ
jgi:F-type H+-transporting ATPase subunit b